MKKRALTTLLILVFVGLFLSSDRITKTCANCDVIPVCQTVCGECFIVATGQWGRCCVTRCTYKCRGDLMLSELSELSN